ncbi:MAG: hypothetical protein KME06_04550 [Kastovskya adunca ATA6-11-RM4]|jgi:hypothetical protein|nr:hypothetical protein [Kastovskya adunca ATA6-11-RM4]
MKRIFNTVSSIAIATTATFSISTVPAMAAILSNQPGAGTVTVGVDAFGSFGAFLGGDGTSDAFYTTVDGDTARTVAQSGIIVRRQGEDPIFLTSGSFFDIQGGENPLFLDTASDDATSTFRLGDLSFNLRQELTAQLDDGNNQIGSVLTQTYLITNTSTTAIDFDLFRVLDANVLFSGRFNDDGGGRVSVPKLGDLVFATDTISEDGTIDPIKFVGITATGGTIPATGRFEVDFVNNILLGSIQPIGGRLRDGVVYDAGFSGNNNDILELSDLPVPDIDTNLSSVLDNVFSLNVGETNTYTTRTFFGRPLKKVEPEPEPIPEPTLALSLLALGGLGVALQSSRKQQKKVKTKV